MQALRDDPQCAREAFDAVLDAKDPGLNAKLTFALPSERRAGARTGRPKVAVLREQGVNGQREMAATLDRAGFEAHDVHMTDLLDGPQESRRLPRRRSRAAASPTATCSAPAKAGPRRSSITSARGRCSRSSSRAATRSRSASATAARCSRR